MRRSSVAPVFVSIFAAALLFASACTYDWTVSPLPPAPGQRTDIPGGAAAGGGDAGTDASVAEISCEQGGTCTCPGSGPCAIDCPTGGCAVACGSAASCSVDCARGQCTIDCGSAQSCETSCSGGACSVSCAAAGSCTTSECAGGACSCTGGGCR